MKSYTLIIKRPEQVKQRGYTKDVESEELFFKSFSTPETVVRYISTEAKDSNLKVKKIMEMDFEGETKEVTVSFVDGVLSLVPVIKAESISDVVRELADEK